MVPSADISTVVVDKPQKAVLLLEHVERKETPGLKLIIVMEPFEEALKDRGQECGVVIKSMQAVEVSVCFWAVYWAIAGWLLSQDCWLSAPLMSRGGRLGPSGCVSAEIGQAFTRAGGRW